MRRTKHTMTFDVERGSSSVEYEVDFTVTPGEKERGPTYDCGGTPASPPEVEDVEVFYVYRKGAKTLRERRPELDDLVSEEELLEYAGDEAADFADDGPDPDDERDRALDREYDRKHGDD